MSSSDANNGRPTDVVVVNNELQVHGYPEAAKFAELKTRKAKRLADLRTHEFALTFCEGVMQDALKLQGQTDNIRRAIITGVVATYFSCFGDSKNVGPLSPKRIFKGRDDGKAAFEYYRNLRNKLYTHNESDLVASHTIAVLDKNNDLLDVMSSVIGMDVHTDQEHAQTLYSIVKLTLDRVREEATDLHRLVAEEFSELSKFEIADLPAASWTVPDTKASMSAKS